MEDIKQVRVKGRLVGYMVDAEGVVTKLETGKVLSVHNHNSGYKSVFMRVNGRSRMHYIHNILMHTFHPLPESIPYDRSTTVNHKNGSKHDNRLENLEWCTHRENVKHAYDFRLKKASRGPVNYNVYLFRNDDEREFIGTPRGLFHTFGETDRLFMQGINSMVRGYNMTSGASVTQHRGWRKIKLVKEVKAGDPVSEIYYKPLI